MKKFLEELRERYEKLYLKGDYDEKAEKQKDRILKTLILIGICFLLMITAYGAGRLDERDSMGRDNGKVISIERPDKGHVELELGLGFSGEDGPLKKKVNLDIKAPEDGEHEEERPQAAESQRSIDDLVRDLKDQVENDPARKTIVLPTSLSDGTKVVWYELSDYKWVMLVLIMFFAMYYVYRSRFDILKREEKRAYDDITLELPCFINKCVLLLNGGLVLSDVLTRITAEYENSSRDSYFYSQLCAIMENCDGSNSRLDEQLKVFAGNTGNRELSRIAAIISDNLTKGTSLVEKLEAESSYLWFMRKKKAEELGRLAETKLTFPLMLLLIVLIAVTVAPAMLEM